MGLHDFNNAFRSYKIGLFDTGVQIPAGFVQMEDDSGNELEDDDGNKLVAPE